MILAVTALAAASLGAGWGVDSYSTSERTITSVEADQGRPFDVFAIYDNLDRGSAFPNADATLAMRRGATLFLNITATHVVELNPDTYVKLPLCWRGIASGRRDGMLAEWTAAIHATGYSKIIVTFAHEPDGGDNEHAPKCDVRTPAEYVAAFDRVKRFFVGHNLDLPFAFMPILRHFDTPGLVDPYVPWGAMDIVGGDTYDHAENWRTPAEMFGSFAGWRAAHAPELPVLIGEFGVDSRPADAPDLIEQSADYLEATFGADLVAVNWNLKLPWDIHSPAARRALIAASRGGYWGGTG